MTAADIEAIREQLCEARRYCEVDPVACAEMISDASPRASHFSPRLAANLQVASDSLLVDPEVTRSYLYAAVHELGQIRNDLLNATRDGRQEGPFS